MPASLHRQPWLRFASCLDGVLVLGGGWTTYQTREPYLDALPQKFRSTPVSLRPAEANHAAPCAGGIADCGPLIEKLVEGGRRAQRPAQIPLLKFQIQQALRLAKRAVDGLVQVPARPALGSRP